MEGRPPIEANCNVVERTKKFFKGRMQMGQLRVLGNYAWKGDCIEANDNAVERTKKLFKGCMQIGRPRVLGDYAWKGDRAWRQIVMWLKEQKNSSRGACKWGDRGCWATAHGRATAHGGKLQCG
jgi:hypothetical protein